MDGRLERKGPALSRSGRKSGPRRPPYGRRTPPPERSFLRERSSESSPERGSETPPPESSAPRPARPDPRELPEVSLPGAPPEGSDADADADDELVRNVVADLHAYGVCVLDEFMGRERGLGVLQEVLDMYSAGVFRDGQLVSNAGVADLKTVRSDRIAWVDGGEPNCESISRLIKKVDAVIVRAGRLAGDGKLGGRTIRGRTKAMVACYPGFGSHYVKHVDNPNKDGRCITAIYYLNLDWDVRTNGGLLRIYPEGWKDRVADIEPVFDRALFFWSDRRNPHEVQPAFNTRYAITLWYFDSVEKREACRRLERERRDSAQRKAIPD